MNNSNTLIQMDTLLLQMDTCSYVADLTITQFFQNVLGLGHPSMVDSLLTNNNKLSSIPRGKLRELIVLARAAYCITDWSFEKGLAQSGVALFKPEWKPKPVATERPVHGMVRRPGNRLAAGLRARG